VIQQINQPIEVIAAHKAEGVKLIPRLMVWNGRVYKFTRIGFRHPTSKGNRTIHILTVSDEATTYRLEFDSESLLWTLREISDGLPN
jgi:hypothetical protein